MRRIFISFVLSCTVFVFGCTSQVEKLTTINKTVRQDGDKAMVVVKINNFDYLDITKLDNISAKPQQYRILKPQRMFVYNYAQSMYSIEPGIYYISFIAIDSSQGVYYSEAPGIDAQGKVAYGAFEIKAGEVLYLGDFECQWKSTNTIKKLSLFNKLNEVKRDLDLVGHQDLAAKITTAKYYPKGATLSLNEIKTE